MKKIIKDFWENFKIARENGLDIKTAIWFAWLLSPFKRFK